MVAVAVAGSSEEVDGLLVVRERLEAFGIEVLGEAVNRPVQLRNGGLYLRGLIEDGARKSLEPMVARLGGEADYESLQQFMAVSTWDPVLVVRAVAERVAPEIDVQAWVLDDTGFPKDGKRSPGVKRQYSGTLGKIGSCQIGVSVHAVGTKGTVPLGWALYLSEEWCEDPGRRAKAKIPEEVEFQTKPELGVELIERAAGWKIARRRCSATRLTAITPSCASACTTQGSSTCCPSAPDAGVRARHDVHGPGAPGAEGRPARAGCARPRPGAIAELVAGCPDEQWQTVTFRDGPDGEEPVTSRFASCGSAPPTTSRSAHRCEPREEWLIAEWPEGHDQPSDYWIANLPEDTPPEQLARLARLRWKIELDYRQLKGELGLDHYEGRSYLGWHHHMRDRHRRPRLPDPGAAEPKSPSGRPDPPSGSPTAPAHLQVLDRPLLHLPADDRPRRPTPPPTTTTTSDNLPKH